jgi:hypothetical protein
MAVLSLVTVCYFQYALAETARMLGVDVEWLCTNIQKRLHNLMLLFISSEYLCKAEVLTRLW